MYWLFWRECKGRCSDVHEYDLESDPVSLAGSAVGTCEVATSPQEGCEYCHLRVCMCVCLSVRSHVSKQHVQTSRNFLYVLTLAVARSSSDDNAIRYVLAVLWMASCFHIMGASKWQELIRRWDSERELFTTTSYNTSKYNPLLSIQHDAGRGAASGCGLVILMRRFSHAHLL